MEYRTKDFGEASALYCESLELVRLDKGEGFYWFIFNNFGKCTELSSKYWMGELLVNAKKYKDSMRDLKERLFSRG